MSSVTVSIILPTYNRVSHCKKAIESIILQDYKLWELIIIDDASEVRHSEELNLYLKTLTNFNIHYIRNRKNLGLQTSLVKATQKATGKYIARLDDDDIWLSKQKLSRQIAILDTNPTIVLIGTHYQNELGTPHFYPITDKNIRKQLPFRCPFCHSSVMFRKKAYEKIGGYNECIKYGEDWDLWLRFSKIGKLANLPLIAVQYRQEGITMTSKSSINQHVSNWKIVQPHLNLYSNKYLIIFYHKFIIFYFSQFYFPRLHIFFQFFFKRIFKTTK